MEYLEVKHILHYIGKFIRKFIEVFCNSAVDVGASELTLKAEQRKTIKVLFTIKV